MLQLIAVGLRLGSGVVRLRGLRIRIPPGTWLSVSCKCLVLSVCVGLITRPMESYRVWCDWVWSWNLDNEEDWAQQVFPAIHKCMLPPNSPASTRIWYVWLKPSLLAWVFLMAYSKAKSKINSAKASYITPFLIGKLRENYLPTWTLLQVSFRHVFVSLTIFTGIPNTMRTLYKTSLFKRGRKPAWLLLVSNRSNLWSNVSAVIRSFFSAEWFWIASYPDFFGKPAVNIHYTQNFSRST